MRIHRDGFTLVELLVALVILAAIVAGLLSLTRSTLQFTGLTRAVSTSVEDIADAEGYVTDMLRNAKAVYTNASVVVDGSTVTCTNTQLGGLNGRCVAIATPVLGSTADEPIENFDLSVFAVVPIADLYVSEGLERGWNGENTLALVEYRVSDLCTSTCSLVPANVDTTTYDADAVGFLLGGLSGKDGADNDVQFFQAPDDQDYTLELTVVARANAAASQPFVIRETPVSLQVAIRR